MSEHTYSTLLKAAARVADVKGYTAITRLDVATEAGCSEGLVSYYLGSVDAMRSAVLTYAIADNLFGVIAQGIALNDPTIDTMTYDEKKDVLDSILEE